MEFKGNEVHLTEFERRQAGLLSGFWDPFVITVQSLGGLNDRLIEGSGVINELVAECDVISREDNIAIFTARTRLMNRQKIFKKIIEHANDELPNLFADTMDAIETPEDFLKTTR